MNGYIYECYSYMVNNDNDVLFICEFNYYFEYVLSILKVISCGYIYFIKQLFRKIFTHIT